MSRTDLSILPQTIRGKLGLAFGAIAAAAIVGEIVGQSSYSVIRQKLAIITERSVPAVIASQRIGEVTARIAAGAPALHSADGQAALTAQHDELTAYMGELRAAVQTLAERSQQAESIHRMNALADEVASTLVVQTRSVAERLELGKQSRLNVETLASVHLQFNAAIQPIIDFEMREFRALSSSVVDNTAQSIQRLNELAMKGLLPILLLRLQAGTMVQSIEAASEATTREQVDSAWQSFVSANSIASRQLTTLQENKFLTELLVVEPVQNIFEDLVSLGSGNGNVFDRQRRRLDAEEDAAAGTTASNFAAAELMTVGTLVAELDRVISPMITKIRGRTAIEGIELNDYVAGTLNAIASEGLVGIGDLQKLEALGNYVAGVLTAAALLESEQELATFQSNFARAATEFDGILKKYDSDATMSPVIDSARQLIRLGNGDSNIIATHTRELQAIERGERSLAESIRLMEELSAATAGIVAATRTDGTQAASAAEGSLVAGWWTLGVTATTGILVLLAVWLYVNRSLGARLRALSDSMLAIAGGNLRASLPPTGSDEIGRMAAALALFRDTAVEVEEKNLTEIAEARQHLVDAIESISEGFSLYDRNDCLVMSNSQYRTLLYPGLEDVMQPGTPFVTILRAAADRGLIADAENRVEEWVAERLERHRNPGEPHIQHRTDGRWILISERKTDDGGTVAVYSDITEIKQHEQDLADKSNTLEQLSNQLSKYLAPQVYGSIFSGKQEVKIASSRKKLTVFFSDIAGFTETADRLESEELSRLLNHYLTEMSRIALDHGATIDKYVGDAILVFFSDPETRGVKEDALACVQMAIAMRERMHQLEDIWRESGIGKPLRVRMGIHTGYCTVGNFGSEERMDYTIIGSAVNTASRLQSLATPGEILISFETFAHVRDQILCEEYGETEVKGIAYPVTSYRVVDFYQNLGEQRRHFHKEHPHVKIDLDIDAMTSDDLRKAKDVLLQAMDLVSQSESSMNPGKAMDSRIKDKGIANKGRRASRP